MTTSQLTNIPGFYMMRLAASASASKAIRLSAMSRFNYTKRKNVRIVDVPKILNYHFSLVIIEMPNINDIKIRNAYIAYQSFKETDWRPYGE